MILHLQIPKQYRVELLAGLTLYLLLVLATLVFFQGLSGSFLVDDFENLEGLEKLTDSPTLEAGIQYVATGITSTLGRPLALATFALQFRSWPNHPENFIFINILLHLLNGCVLFWSLVRLLRLNPVLGNYSKLLPAAVTAFWLLAALHTGAVLYVVQRMAVLSGTCVLLGLLLYLIARGALLNGRERFGTALMLLSTAFGLGLGVLAKESAALFPLLLLILEYSLLKDVARSKRWWACSAPCLFIPLSLLLIYLAVQIPSFLSTYQLRDFSLAERLLTEARVLFLYLQKFFFPSLYGVRLYYDDLVISKSLWMPWSTMASVAAWLVAIGLALALRRRANVFSFAALWFLAGHFLESTFIPLELAFEHRNYIAIIGPAFFLAWGLGRLLTSPKLMRLRPFLLGAAVMYGMLMFAAAWQSASLWGKPWELTHHWGITQPDSRRAQRGLAQFYWKIERPDEAVRVYEEGLSRWPGEVSFLLGIMELGCAYPQITVPDITHIQRASGAFDSNVLSTISTLDIIITATELGLCRRYPPDVLWAVMEAAFEAPALAYQQVNHLLMQSRIAELAGDRLPARDFLDQAIQIAPHAVILVQAATWAIEGGDIARARFYLDMVETSSVDSPIERYGYRTEIAHLWERIGIMSQPVHP